MVLYDTLIDDDEDVRDQGALTTSSLLSAVDNRHSHDRSTNYSLSAPAAKRRLLQFLEDNYRTSTCMSAKAVERLTGQQLAHYAGNLSQKSQALSPVTAFKLRPVIDIFLEAQRPQEGVFAEEKQNLYVDAVQEAELWASTLVRLDPDAKSASATGALELWTTEGLSYLLTTLRNVEDGPLGVTSNPEIYTLIMRVVLSAKTLIAKKEIGDASYRSLMKQLLQMGENTSLHDLLIDHITHIEACKSKMEELLANYEI